MTDKLIVNTSNANYFARVWRTEVLRNEAERDVVKLLTAFVPEGFHVRIDKGDYEIPGFPHAPYDKVRATLCDKNRDGSDAHFFVSSKTEAGCIAKLLAVILDGQGFYPLT